MQYAHHRRLMVAVIASGTVLVTLAAVGAVGLIRGQQDSARLRPSGPDLHVISEPMDPVSHPRPIPTSSDAETFARSVGRALFTWDTRYDGGVSDWAQVIVDVADPTERVAVASDIRNYLPADEMWERLGTYGTRQRIELTSVSVPLAWSTALEQAAPGEIPPGAGSFTVTGTSHRQGTWGTEPLSTQRQVSFTIFVVCSRDTPCALLRLSQIDRPLG